MREEYTNTYIHTFTIHTYILTKNHTAYEGIWVDGSAVKSTAVFAENYSLIPSTHLR